MAIDMVNTDRYALGDTIRPGKIWCEVDASQPLPDDTSREMLIGGRRASAGTARSSGDGQGLVLCVRIGDLLGALIQDAFHGE